MYMLLDNRFVAKKGDEMFNAEEMEWIKIKDNNIGYHYRSVEMFPVRRKISHTIERKNDIQQTHTATHESHKCHWTWRDAHHMECSSCGARRVGRS